ncbi:hypothetical protein EYF80_027272 [Liparis tanakae]|uniref:Uncharacterized protein n=1 Tax=Liparis tanakae TaxID=230148 RepID=A0A4Z2H9G7_9TELE|nr:hypothetical protein EYF80_027272 [Liparis tanakae]
MNIKCDCNLRSVHLKGDMETLVKEYVEGSLSLARVCNLDVRQPSSPRWFGETRHLRALLPPPVAAVALWNVLKKLRPQSPRNQKSPPGGAGKRTRPNAPAGAFGRDLLDDDKDGGPHEKDGRLQDQMKSGGCLSFSGRRQDSSVSLLGQLRVDVNQPITLKRPLNPDPESARLGEVIRTPCPSTQNATPPASFPPAQRTYSSAEGVGIKDASLLDMLACRRSENVRAQRETVLRVADLPGEPKSWRRLHKSVHVFLSAGGPHARLVPQPITHLGVP